MCFPHQNYGVYALIRRGTSNIVHHLSCDMFIEVCLTCCPILSSPFRGFVSLRDSQQSPLLLTCCLCCHGGLICFSCAREMLIPLRSVWNCPRQKRSSIVSPLFRSHASDGDACGGGVLAFRIFPLFLCRCCHTARKMFCSSPVPFLCHRSRIVRTWTACRRRKDVSMLPLL